MKPPYYFTAKEMRREHSARQRFSSRGWFLPPKTYGHNLAHAVAHFQHIDGLTREITSIPSEAALYRTYSIYIYNATVWTVDYDATTKHVHDGQDTVGSSGYTTDEEDASQTNEPPPSAIMDDNYDDDDWVSMSFNHLDNSVSYAGRRKQNWRLCIERRNQDWARLILPDPYMAQTKTDDSAQGGLIGDLPLLLGLVALAVPDDQVPAVLCEVVSEPWQFSLSDPLRRGDGWWDGRGLVVSVFAHPESSFEELRHYESGGRGAILP